MSMTYLALVNHVIRESGNEMNELTPTTWNTAAGQRMYPRLKNYVRQAWKHIQMDKDQWHFNNGELYTTVYPRFKFQMGTGAGLPQPGALFRGLTSGMTIVARRVILTDGDWVNVPASGQIEFTYLDGDTRLPSNEVFEEIGGNLGGFVYLERGSYDFGLDHEELANIRWDQFVASQPKMTALPLSYIPWENWFYQSYGYNTGSRTTPQYVSQDFEGNVVFYPQSLDPFNVHIVYAAVPQELTNWDDVPARIPSQYHEWIAWEALLLLATYDKNSMLAAHANRYADKYRKRASKNLMPLISWRGSPFNE